jgi:F-type H+-transporting ATPase subunit delta
MTTRAVARRYAVALFDVVTKSGDVARAERELRTLADLAAGHAELARIFETPLVPPARKRALAEAVLKAVGGVSDHVSRLVLLLADRDRLAALGDVADLFAARAMQERHVVPAEIVTAVPLADGQRAALAAALGRATGSEVIVTTRVDPAIVGGVVARVGSVVFDGSVTRQLEKLKEKLLEA